MSTNQPTNRPDHRRQDVLRGLEQLARELDSRQFPGSAWPAAPRPRSQRRLLRVLAPWAAVAAAAAALVFFVVFHYAIVQGPAVGPLPAGESITARAVQPTKKPAPSQVPAVAQVPAPAEATVADLVVVEDLDSYSIIDLTSDTPLVSFATKDSCIPTDAVLVALDLPEKRS